MSSIQAQVQVAHPRRGEVRIDVGVGSISSPTWSYSFYPRMTIGEDLSHANVNTTLDLSDAAAYWPPSSSRQWWVRVTDDNRDGVAGTITQFNLINGSTTLSTVTALPVAVPDGGAAYAYIGGAAPVFTSIGVSPSSASVVVSNTQQFTATALDQSNNPMSKQPTFSWSVNGGGTISSTGLFTAGSATGGPFTVTASSGGITGSASVSVISQPVQPTLHVASISMNVVSNKSGGQAKATVTVLNNTGAPVSGATVTGSWSGLVSGTSSGTTSTSGNATLSSPKTKASGTITFTVTNITASGYVYSSSSNTVTTATTTK